MASKKVERMAKLVEILRNAESWVPAAALARMLGTTDRTVRSYVAEHNLGPGPVIESSGEGYRIACASHGARPQGDEHSARAKKDEATFRRNYVASRLIVKPDGLSVFSAAERLHVSESTLLGSVLPKVRELANEFGLEVHTRGFVIGLDGPEQGKRRLMGRLATEDSDGYFSSTETLEELFPEFDVESILATIVKICQDAELLINDFALNNLLMHLLVIIIRLKSQNALPDEDGSIDLDKMLSELAQRDAILRCASGISAYFEREFGCEIPPADYQQIVVLVALSVERCDYKDLNLEGLASLVDQGFLELVKDAADRTVARYAIPAFDEPLLLQLTLHVYNAVQRAKYHVSYPNPLAHQIKHEYAPVYDMAVFFAHQLACAHGVQMDENEIAFIAFHIGAYLERCPAARSAVTCIVLVSNYHGMATQLAGDVRRALGEDAVVADVMTADEYRSRKPDCDFVVSSAQVAGIDVDQIVAGPILTRRGEREIREKVDQIERGRETSQSREFLKGLLVPDLYARNVELEGGRDAVIDYLGSLAEWLGYAGPEFIRDVHAREQASSTAFTDCLAVPHSIGAFAERSFIAVLHNDAPIPWGGRSISFVLLIGIAEKDMALFRGAFDIIVETFTSVEKTAALLRTGTYEEFVAAFTKAL